MRLLWIGYSLGCIRVILLAHRTHSVSGIWLGVAANVANVVGFVLGGFSRGLAGCVLLVVGALTTKRAFARADVLPRDTDEERSANRAAMALLALTLAEAILVAISGFAFLAALE